MFASQLLQPINFTVQAGQFGTYAGIGPIPATNTNITTPSQPTAYIFGTASQPLLTLYKINIHIHGQELSVEQAAQKVREERISIVDDVRQAYYSIVEIQNAIDATDASIKQYQELDRISTQYLAEQVVLKSETLEVKAKLADEQYKLLQLQDKLASAKETLNNLLGRDINTQFQATNPTELSAVEQNLPEAQALALAQNPEGERSRDHGAAGRQCQTAGQSAVSAGSRRLLPLPLALWRQLCAHECDGAGVRVQLGTL